MTRILAIDPGNTESGWVVIDADTHKPLHFGKTNNEVLLLDIALRCDDWDVNRAAIEMVAPGIADIAPIRGRMKTGRNGAGNTTSTLTHSLDSTKEGLAMNATRAALNVPPPVAHDEEWRPIVGYEDRYLISSHGRVLSLPNAKNKTARLISVYPASSGYPYANLWRDNRMKRRAVHSLILQAFVGPRPEGQEARHLDGNAARSILSNLAWGTKSENGYDRVRHGTHPHARKTHCPQGHPYDESNTYVQPRNGQRVCRACRRAHQLAWLKRKSS